MFFDRSIFQNHALATGPPTLVVDVSSLANGVPAQIASAESPAIRPQVPITDPMLRAAILTTNTSS